MPGPSSGVAKEEVESGADGAKKEEVVEIVDTGGGAPAVDSQADLQEIPCLIVS